jgi:hypothetical protein
MNQEPYLPELTFKNDEVSVTQLLGFVEKIEQVAKHLGTNSVSEVVEHYTKLIRNIQTTQPEESQPSQKHTIEWAVETFRAFDHLMRHGAAYGFIPGIAEWYYGQQAGREDVKEIVDLALQLGVTEFEGIKQVITSIDEAYFNHEHGPRCANCGKALELTCGHEAPSWIWEYWADTLSEYELTDDLLDAQQAYLYLGDLGPVFNKFLRAYQVYLQEKAE